MLSAVTTNAVLRAIAFVSLLGLTIWQYRKNRAVILGVVTVILFLGFLVYLNLAADPRVPSWAAPAVFAFIVSAGLVVIGFVVADFISWLKREWKASIASGDPRKPETK